MLKKFYPKKIFDSFKDIKVEYLKDNNIKGVILDIDNTLVPYDIEYPDEEVINWIDNLKSNDIKVALVSNGSPKRVEKFNEKLKLFAIPRADKPLRRNFKIAINHLGLKNENIAVVGDQIFTDVLGANRMKLMPIMVQPIVQKEIALIKLKRLAEKFIMKCYDKQSS